MINLTDKISCPKCNMKIDTKTELDRHTDELVQDENFDEILEVNSQNWKSEVLQSEMLVLVEFWHTSCQSCKEFNPIFIQVAKEMKNQLKFAKLNVLSNVDNRALAIKYGLTSTPTLIFFCNGKHIATRVERDGFETKERLKQLINKMKSECSDKRR
jgi:thioredoxin 1